MTVLLRCLSVTEGHMEDVADLFRSCNTFSFTPDNFSGSGVLWDTFLGDAGLGDLYLKAGDFMALPICEQFRSLEIGVKLAMMTTYGLSQPDTYHVSVQGVV